MKQTSPEEKSPAASGSAVSLSRKPSNNQDIDSVWRRPQASQVSIFIVLCKLMTHTTVLTDQQLSYDEMLSSCLLNIQLDVHSIIMC